MSFSFPLDTTLSMKQPEHVFQLMQAFYDKKNEIDFRRAHFWVIGLTKDLRAIFFDLVAKGANRPLMVDPSQVFSQAILKRSSCIILVHNSMTGIVQPTELDMITTSRIIHSGDILKISVEDHIIITKNTFYSFQKNDFFPKVKNLTKTIILSYDEKLLLYGPTIRHDIATQMILLGYPLDQVQKITKIDMQVLNDIFEEFQESQDSA